MSIGNMRINNSFLVKTSVIQYFPYSPLKINPIVLKLDINRMSIKKLGAHNGLSPLPARNSRARKELNPEK
jgi:hypothetical protein